MLLRALRFGTIMAASVNSGLAVCHVLEMPVKGQLDGPRWLETQQLYQHFGTFGLLEPVSVLMAGALTYVVRRRPNAFRLTALGADLRATSLVAWLALVAPMNAQFGSWTSNTIPADWTRTRDQWEFAHSGRAILQVLGVAGLVLSVVAETPDD